MRGGVKSGTTPATQSTTDAAGCVRLRNVPDTARLLMVNAANPITPFLNTDGHWWGVAHYLNSSGAPIPNVELGEFTTYYID